MGQVRGRAAAPGSFQSPWRDPAAVEVVVRSGVLWAARASLRLPAGPHRRRGELFVRPSVLTKHEAARLGGEESSYARAPCQVTCYCTRRTAFACRGFKRLSPWCSSSLWLDTLLCTESGIQTPGHQAPFSPNVWILVVKLREAAFGSLGPMRLCSRACLVLICCTPKLNKYYTYGA